MHFRGNISNCLGILLIKVFPPAYNIKMTSDITLIGIGVEISNKL